MSQIHILSLIEKKQNERPKMQKQTERSVVFELLFIYFFIYIRIYGLELFCTYLPASHTAL